MRYRLLGRSGLRVSELCLGTMVFGDARHPWGATPAHSTAILAAFAEAGGNFVDTSNSYADGESERIVGAFVAADRDRWVISTKYVVNVRRDDPNAGGSHRKSLVRSLEASLRRLGTDYVDVYWVHMWDAMTPLEEVVRALDDAVRAGKVLYVGISDTPAWLVSRAVTLAELRGWTPFVGLQVPYSLVERTAERELLPMARALDLGVTVWSPLADGLLAGRTEGSRFGAVAAHRLTDRNLAIAAAVGEVARARGVSAAQVAIAWILAQRSRGVLIPILGARIPEQLVDTLGSVRLELTEGELRALDEVSRIELGFPHDWGGFHMPYGDAYGRIDDHRA